MLAQSTGLPDKMANECKYNVSENTKEDFNLPSALSHGISSVLSSLI